MTRLDRDLVRRTHQTLSAFTVWLEKYGQVSYDHQSFFAGALGRRAKALYYKNQVFGTIAVAPMILCEAFLPSARRVFSTPVRFPIADAHYAMGFAFLSEAVGDEHHRRAVTFLDALGESRCAGFAEYCWGYPFDWVTRGGTIRAGTPLITSTPYAYEAFRQLYEIDGDERWCVVCRSIAEHAVNDIKDFPVSASASACSYSPYDGPGVVNAAAYRAWLLTAAATHFADETYRRIGERNLAFVLSSQAPDGSWPYSVDGQRNFVDHFHTCFVLKALAKMHQTTQHAGCADAIMRGVAYYREHLFDEEGLPKPFSKAPRLTVYRRELYDCAECINLCVLLRDRVAALQRTLERVLTDVLNRWLKSDGSFRSRELLVGWDNVPMHRWAQSQMFRSLAFLMHQETAGALSRYQ